MPASVVLQNMLSLVFLVGMVVAFLACAVARWQEIRDGDRREAPVGITGLFTGVLLVLSLVVLAARVSADTYTVDDPCRLVDPNESWPAWLVWVASGCFWW